MILKLLKDLTDTSISQQQLRYLPQSIRVEEAINPHLIRLSMMLISFAIIVFITWAVLTNIKEVSKTKGEIVPEGFVQVVQHLHGGIVTQINIEEGQLVREGQALIVIDDGTAKQDLAQIKVRRKALKIKEARLKAFLENVNLNLEKINEEISNEEKLTAQNELDHQLSKLNSLKATVKIKEKNLKLEKENLNKSQQIFNKGYLSKSELNDLKSIANEAENQFSFAKSNYTEFKGIAYNELAKTRGLISEDNELITKLEERVTRLIVNSPVRGIVKGMDINTLGSVIKPGQTLMEIVPLDKPLIARVKISPTDIGHVQVGQMVKVKIGAYDFSRYGSLDGQLAFISATSFEEDGEPYYRGRVKLSKNYLGDDFQKNIVLPGMRVEADVITGEKSVLEYLLKPVKQSMQTAFTER